MTKVFDFCFCLAPEECSSVSTFKGVCGILEDTQPLAFLLENVDSIESKQTQTKDPDSEETPSAVLVFRAFGIFGLKSRGPNCNSSKRQVQIANTDADDHLIDADSAVLTLCHDSDLDTEFSDPVYGFRQLSKMKLKLKLLKLPKTCQAARSFCKVQSGRRLEVPPIPRV